MKFRILAVLLVTFISAAVLMPISVAIADTNEPNSAFISFEPSSDTSGVCIDQSLFLLAASYSTVNTSDSFTLNVRLDQNLCNPFIAKAAIYSMPGNGVAWPQELVSVQEFSIQARGIYSITFPKTCLAQQFDVLTGSTPQTISPTGPYHGPLLFPVGLSSALQWFGFECVQGTVVTTDSTSTSSSSTTSTSSTSSTTTTTGPGTTEATVLGTSVTNTGGPGSGSNVDGVQVAGIRVGGLPVTGSDSNMIIFFAVSLLLAGFTFVASARRRKSLLK